MSGLTPEQRAWRKDGIGSSDIAVVVELVPPSWGSRWALFMEKTGLVEDEQEGEHLEFGQYAEPMVARYFRDRTGLEIAGEQTWLTHPEHEWMRATADGFVFDGGFDKRMTSVAMTDALGVLEIKTTSMSPQEWETGGVPDHIQCQSQWLMAVAGFDRVWLAVLHLAFGRPRFRIYEVERDEADIAWLTEEGAAFWELVRTGVPPDVDGSEATTRALQRAWEPEPGESVEVDPDTFRDLQKARAQAELCERISTSLTNTIKAAMQSATEGVIDGVAVLTWRPSKAVDVEKLLIDLSAEEIEAYSRFDLSAWSKKNRKRAETYKTEPGSRRFVLKPTKEIA